MVIFIVFNCCGDVNASVNDAPRIAKLTVALVNELAFVVELALHNDLYVAR